MLRSLFNSLGGFSSREARRDVPEEPTLPQPASEADAAEVQVRPHSMVFPNPLMQMPYELAQTTELEYVHDEGHSNLVRLSLPIYARVEVFPTAGNSECILVATQNRRMFGQGGDGLTAYGSVNRTDFSFRTGVFSAFPDGVSARRAVKLDRNQWNEMSLAISEREATYWINGVRVASVRFRSGELPAAELYIGVVSYATLYLIRRFDVSRDPRMLNFVCTDQELRELSLFKERIITLFGAVSAGTGTSSTLSISCLNMAGEQLHGFDAVAGVTEFREIRFLLTEQLMLTEFEVAKLVLPDGTLLDQNDDNKPTVVALRLGEGI